MKLWILIIIVHGWGGITGPGATGNAITSIEFYSQEECETAGHAVTEMHKNVTGLCVQK